MVVVRLQGGLGNQLFQYAFGRSLSLALKTRLGLDTASYGLAGTYRFAPTILRLNIDWTETDPRLMRLLHAMRNHKKILAGTMKRLTSIPLCARLMPCYLRESDYDGKLPRGRVVYVEGHFERLGYFRQWEHVLKEELTIKGGMSGANAVFGRMIEGVGAVSVHYRGGPYAADPAIKRLYTECTPAYYREAMNYMACRLSSPVFFVFTNDIEAARERLGSDHRLVFVTTDGPDYEHLALMAACGHHIIANSTFSWWGAWLGRNPEKRVTAPRKWLAEGRQSLEPSIPPEWVRIEN